jgi:diaminobutyrate-2-oxoglutarate transaminase
VRNRNRRIRSVKGRGMMRGLDVGTGAVAAQIVKASLARGLVIETSGGYDEIVKVLSPLTIEESELKQGLAILKEAVDEVLTDQALGSAA